MDWIHFYHNKLSNIWAAVKMRNALKLIALLLQRKGLP